MNPRSPSVRLGLVQAENALDLVEELRERRKSLELTQREVAGRMHRDPAVVSNLERMGADPRWSSLRRYATALGVAIDYQLVPIEELEVRLFGSSAGPVEPDDAPDPDALRQAFAGR